MHQNFYQNYAAINSSGEQLERVYNLLDNDYIQEFNITKENLIGKYGNSKTIEVDVTKNIWYGFRK